MPSKPPTPDFEIHVDQDCVSPTMEEPAAHTDQPFVSADEVIAQSEPEVVAEPTPPVERESDADIEAAVAEDTSPEDDAIPTPEPDTTQEHDTTLDSSDLEEDSLDKLIQDGYVEEHEPDADEHADTDANTLETSPVPEQAKEDQDYHVEEEQPADLEQNDAQDTSELDYTTTDSEAPNDDASSILESVLLERRDSVRTEALIQAAARAVVALRQDDHGEAGDQEHHEDADESVMSSTTAEDAEAEDPDETIHLNQDDDDHLSRPQSSASHTLSSPTEQSEGDGTEGSSHRGLEDDVFSDRSPRSSVYSADGHFDDDTYEQMTEKGDQSPHSTRSRVTSGTSGISMSGASCISDLSRLSRYEKEDFVPTSRSNRPAFRSPSSVRAIQMSSPTPSIRTSPSRSGKRQTGFPTISRLGSPSVSGQYSPRGRSTPSRFKRQDPAPLVLLHVTLLPLRWVYGDVVNHFEAKKVAPIIFSSEGLKNLRGAWRQLQDRLGDTVLERGILLPHPQNDYEILEERLLEALELPLRRRARILECGHYLGPSNEMTISDESEDDSEDASDTEGSKPETRHWCKTCKSDIKYHREAGCERLFRIKVYASNGLMSAGAWEACWKEMERVDIEVEPIIDSGTQSDLAKLAAAFDQEHQQRLEAEQNQQMEEEQRLQLEVEQRLSLEEERQQLELQRQQFEEEQRRSLEASQRKFEEERRKIEEEQRQRLEEERRQQFEEERQLLEAQRQEFEEQRLELEQQRKLVEEEQRQHLEEARRQELEEEQRLIEEQRQQLEEARQQFEAERRQRLEEDDELRRLQREDDEQKQVVAPRSTSRTSYAEDELVSSAAEAVSTTDIDGRRRDSDRLREIYGAHSRTSSDGLANTSSPAIHIHVDSGRGREEEQNSRQLTTIPASRDSSLPTGPMIEARHPDSYIPPPTPPSPSEQAYQRREGKRKPLDTASLPELLGETIRVLLQDPKNVAIAVLVVLLAIFVGFAKREERGVEIYKPQPQQQHYQVQPHYQMDSREPVGQVVVNTPSQLVETVYKTVTSEVAPQKAPATQEVELVYHTVTQVAASQETATRVVETIYHTVTQSAAAAPPPPPPAQAAVDNPEVPEVASELPPTNTGADPSDDLNLILDPSLNPVSLDSSDDGDDMFMATSPPTHPYCPVIAIGLDPLVCPAASFDSESDSKPDSNERTLKDDDQRSLQTQTREFETRWTGEHSARDDVEDQALDLPTTATSPEPLAPVTTTVTDTSHETQVITTTETVTLIQTIPAKPMPPPA